MTSTSDRYEHVTGQIEAAARAAGRAPGSVQLLAVSKRQPVGAIAELAALGQIGFGENFVQEACAKIAALDGYALEWHFIGRLQSNKTREVATHFSWVHSIDRLKIARRLSEQRPATAPPLNVCIEVNISGESGKGGITMDEAPEFAAQVRALPRLKLRGLMALPDSRSISPMMISIRCRWARPGISPRRSPKARRSFGWVPRCLVRAPIERATDI